MSFELTSDQTFPKSARLLKKREFFLRPSEKIDTDYFRFIVKRKMDWASRVGISISKKSLKHAVARNRVKRLIREVFRKNRAGWSNLDIHIIGKLELSKGWKKLTLGAMEKEFAKAICS